MNNTEQPKRKYDKSLAKSYDDFADKLEAGHGFWKAGRVICTDPTECLAKRKDLRAKAARYRASYE